MSLSDVFDDMSRDVRAFFSDDPVHDQLRYELWRQNWLKTLPKCDGCGDPIQDEYLWEIDGEMYCEECAKNRFRVTNKAI